MPKSNVARILVGSIIISAGIGVLLPEQLGEDDVGLEVRYRTDDRFTSLDYDHWEFLVGLRF